MYIKPNEEMKKVGIEEGLSGLDVMRGYGIFDFDQTGLLEINRYDCMYVGTGIDEYDDVTDEDCAIQAEKCGYCKIIPVDELPENMMYEGESRRYFGWVDTPENRENIRKFFADQNPEPKEVPVNDLAKQYDELQRLRREYEANFRKVCEDALEQNGLAGELAIGVPRPSVGGMKIREYKGKIIIVNTGSDKMPCYFNFVSDEKDDDCRPIYELVFYPTKPFFDVHEGREATADMNEYVRTQIKQQIIYNKGE